MTFRSKGQLAALFLLTAVTGVVLVAMLTRGGQTAPAPAPNPAAAIGQPPPATKTVGGTGRGPVQDLVAIADEGVWTRVDPDTGRLVSKMTWKSLDPRAGGLFEVDSPRVWAIDEQRTVVIEARRGTIVWPSRDREPESGKLEGDVLIRMVEGARAGPVRDDESPLARVASPSLAFETALGELTTPDAVVFDGMGFRAQGQGLALRLGRDRARPLNLLRIERGGTLTYTPQPPSTRDEPPESTEDPAQPPRAEQPPAEPVIQHYRATVQGDVRVRVGPRTLEGDQVEVWARLVDGELREDAVAPFEPAAAPAPQPGAASDPGPDSPSPDAAAPDDDAQPVSATFTFSGPLEVRPSADEPDALRDDDVALRISSAAGAPVRVSDAASGGTLRAPELRYALTTRRLTLGSRQPAPGDVHMTLPDLADLLARGVDIDLTTGEGSMDGAGEVWLLGALSPAADQPAERGPKPRGATWTDRVDFLLDTASGPVGSGPVLPKDLRMSGSVRVFEGDAGVAARDLRARFTTHTDPAGQLRAALARLTLAGAAAAYDSAGGHIRGDTIEVAFEPDQEGSPRPTAAEVSGAAVASREGQRLAAERISTTLGPDEDGELAVTALRAQGAVAACLDRDTDDGPEEIETLADTLSADQQLDTIELVGAPATISRRGPEGFASITGGSMRIGFAEGARALTVFGPGSAAFDTRRSSAGAREGDTVLDIRWNGAALYNDAQGTVEFDGEADVRAQLGPVERHAGRADRIVIELAQDEPASTDPAAHASAASTDPADAPDQSPARRFARALLEGSTEAPAEVELRRYAPGSGAGVLESLAALRGPSIELDALQSTLAVTGAGLLLFEDRSASQEPDPAAPAPAGTALFAGRSARGTSLFTWENSMRLDRAQRRGEMSGLVRIRHRDARTTDITDLQCALLEIFFTEPQPGSQDAGITLQRAIATGGVAASHKQLQILAHSLTYDAAASQITAAADPAAPERAVSLYDADTGQTFEADSVTVDLATGNYRGEGMRTITVPR
ncbi:MAG: hypothetical protein SFZ24_03555 [Planctomycetota bacterium]|nr:hypothetical protein [Planctomycetota bacterium]